MAQEISLQDIERAARKRAKREARKAGLEEKAQLRMTSLMDIFTNVLIYLLMNYSTTPVDITQTDDLKMPQSSTNLELQFHASIGVTKNVIMVNRKKVCDIRDGVVDASLKKDGQPTSYLILPLLERLKDEANRRKKLARFNSQVKFEGIIILVADQKMPFRLLAEVMYTAGQAEFGKFQFAVIQTEKGLRM